MSPTSTGSSASSRGEGTFLVPSNAPRRSAAIRVSMTDADVVERVAQIFDRAVVELGRREDHHKDASATTIKGGPAIQLMRQTASFLGPTRQKQIKRVLDAWRPRRRPQKRWQRESVDFDLRSCEEACSRAWLAGLLEGEGSFGIDRSRSNAYPVIKLEMADAAVVDRAASLLGAPSVQTRSPREARWSTTKVAAITGGHAAEWMRELHALMGERRAREIAKALAAYRPVRLVSPPDTCVVPGCAEPHRAPGLCHKHY